MYSTVIRPRPAPSDEALAHFQRLLTFETDCWDVHYAMNNGLHDFVLLDVRGIDTAKQGYIDGAVFLPHANINEAALSEYADDTVLWCIAPVPIVMQQKRRRLNWPGSADLLRK